MTPTSRIATNAFPNGQQTIFSYFGVTNDNRLQQIQNLLPNGQNLSSFSYSFDADGQITTWTRQADTNAPTVFNLGYDSADQLLTAILTTNTANGAVLSQYLYGYDTAGNRLTEEIQNGSGNPPVVTGASYNRLNQLTNISGSGGPVFFSGSLDKPGSVTVNGVAARVDPHTTNFVGYANVSIGTNVVKVTAADAYGNSRTNNYQIVVTNNGVAQTITYDLNGNQVSVITGSSTNTYEWDGADRLTAINLGTNRSEFTYDGLGRRVQIVEKQNGTVVTTKKFVWSGVAINEERDATGTTVNKRFFAQGQINGTTNLFYAWDHLGSVREMTDVSGSIRARYEYDAYGRQTKIQGDLNADFGFTRHYLHTVSGLWLAPYREYAAENGRWLNRDPIGEKGGMNLYGFVGNDPINAVDPLGTKQIDWHHIFVQQFEKLFNGAGINIHDQNNGILLPRIFHKDLHALGYNDRWDDFFFKNKGVLDPAILKVKIERFANTLAKDPLFKDYFEVGVNPDWDYLGSFGKAGKALGVFGLIAGIATVSASAETISCELKDFARDSAEGKDDWAYVDALEVRQELNARALFSGDAAMRRMYGGK